MDLVEVRSSLYYNSAFSTILALSNGETRAGSVISARTLASSRPNYQTIMNVDAPAGILKPAKTSATNSFLTLMNTEAMSGFAPEGPQCLLEAYC